MNIQNSNRRKGKYSEDMERLNRGDMVSHKSNIVPPPQDHGDVKRNKKRSAQDDKKTEPEKPQIHVNLVSKLIKTSAECVSVKSETPAKKNLNNQIRSESKDFRKRIKDRYTFRLNKGPTKDEGISKSINCIMQNGVTNEQQLRIETFERRLRDKNHKKLNEIKNSQKNNISIHKAISAIKITQTIKSKDKDFFEKKNESLQTEKTKEVKNMIDKYRKPEIKTITSKQNVRVYKAVTFVEKKQPKPLEIRIPPKEVKSKAPNRTKIPILNVATVRTKSPTLLKRRQLSGKRKVIKRAQNASKSIETLPEVAIIPESVSSHTKPYYEAWVNKTLTATPKYSKKYKDYFDKAKVFQTLKEMRMRKSAELIHVSSEQYAGRIRVRQKSKKEKK